jgi:hypothetical protein
MLGVSDETKKTGLETFRPDRHVHLGTRHKHARRAPRRLVVTVSLGGVAVAVDVGRRRSRSVCTSSGACVSFLIVFI